MVACNKAGIVTTGSAETTRPSLRDGVTAASYSSWCAGLFGHHPPCDAKHHHGVDTSVGVPEPHDFTVRRPADRLRVDTHLTRQRPSHCRSNVRDDAYAPHPDRNAGRIHDLLIFGSIIFWRTV